MADRPELSSVDGPAVDLTLRLLGRSLRWVAPAVVYLAWLGVVLANPGPVAANAVALFPLHQIVGCWVAVAAGNVDDDGHRELCTAAVGSPGRLLVDRAVAAALVVVVVAVVSTLGVALASSPRAGGPADLAAAFAVVLAGGVVGAGVGAVVHRPVLRRVGPTVLAAVAGVLVVLVAPPVTGLLHATDAGDDRAAWMLLGLAAAVGVALVAIGAGLATRLAR